MDIITMRLDDLKPYSNNTKEHPQEQIDEIKESIARYGMNDPIEKVRQTWYNKRGKSVV